MNVKKLIVPGAVGLASFAGIAGGSAFLSGNANAATIDAADTAAVTAAAADSTDAADSDSSTSTADSQQPAQRDESKGGHVGSNGTTETLLNGDTAAKAQAAAEEAIPGGTVLRVENDTEGATYEAHVKKSDGSQVTVKMDDSFNVTGTETGGPGGGPWGTDNGTPTN